MYFTSVFVVIDMVHLTHAYECVPIMCTMCNNHRNYVTAPASHSEPQRCAQCTRRRTRRGAWCARSFSTQLLSTSESNARRHELVAKQTGRRRARLPGHLRGSPADWHFQARPQRRPLPPPSTARAAVLPSRFASPATRRDIDVERDGADFLPVYHQTLVVRSRTIDNPGSSDAFASLCPGKIHLLRPLGLPWVQRQADPNLDFADWAYLLLGSLHWDLGTQDSGHAPIL